MIVSVKGPVITYTSDANDFILTVVQGVDGNSFSLLSNATGTWDFSSGRNLDNLALLLTEARAHAEANAIDWEL